MISHFARGGSTPSLELVQAIQTAVRLLLRVMLRESDGSQVTGHPGNPDFKIGLFDGW